MTKIIVVGDMHLRGTNPRNRIDDFKAAAKLKLLEIFEIATYNKVDAVICPGDVWDRPEVGIAVLLEFAEVLTKSPVPIYVTPGNHDIYGYNISTYGRTSLKLLELLVPQLYVITEPQDVLEIGNNVAVSFQPYASEVDIDGYGYDIPDIMLKLYPDHFKVQVTHGYCMLKPPVWDKFTLIEDCVSRADLIINGHDHKGHQVFKRHDGKLFCNPGALMRKDATKQNQVRDIEVVLWTFAGMNPEYEIIKLKSAKPGNDVLDRTQIESEIQRRASMDNFKMLIESKTGDKALIDIDAVVEEIAKSEGLSEEVVKIALDKIHMPKEY